MFFKQKKIPLIPPLFHENKFVTNFLEKTELFDSFFSKQCFLLNNGSNLPNNRYCKTILRRYQDDIAKINQNLDSGKARSYDNISILMLKICGFAIYKPLAIIFKQCVDTGTFLSEWKKGNIVPIHKKSDKQILKNYRPVSFTPYLW